MPEHPLAEVFGFPVDNQSLEAQRYRHLRLCPYNNRVPSCTKDKASDPLGVCSIFEGEKLAITCPVRFRQNWLIAEDAARFFFPEGTRWLALSEVRLSDSAGQSAGNIDLVLVACDNQGRVVDFGALEVQAVYISGNVRRPFEFYMESPQERAAMTWARRDAPRADYLSSSRKRLAPQLLYKGSILHAWGKKQAVALHKTFYAMLPELPQVDPEEAQVAWLTYDLRYNPQDNRYHLVHERTIYTLFEPALQRITRPDIGTLTAFTEHLQGLLDDKLEGGKKDQGTLNDLIADE